MDTRQTGTGQEARTRVLNVLQELQIEAPDISPATRLREDLEIDSTELVEIAIALERHDAVKVDTDDILAARTFDDLVQLVAEAGSH